MSNYDDMVRTLRSVWWSGFMVGAALASLLLVIAAKADGLIA